VQAVFLVGFMGAGKTTVGQVLAERLNWTFEDLDDRIVKRERSSIGEIFRRSGERAFRLAEHAALRELLAELSAGANRKIVALGGGAFTQKRNTVLLQAGCSATVFLSAPVEELWSRCCEQAAKCGVMRPLLKSMNQFRQLHDSRRRSYLEASLTVETKGRTVHSIAEEME